MLSFCSKFWSKLFGHRSHSSLSKQGPQLTLPNLTSLPNRTQLMVAHFLDHNSSDFMLLRNDADLPDLLATGWMERSAPPAPPGFVCFHFTRAAWQQLLELRHRFLSAAMRTQLTEYRLLKSTEYPWVWGLR